jgi:hypothetical protein
MVAAAVDDILPPTVGRQPESAAAKNKEPGRRIDRVPRENVGS